MKKKIVIYESARSATCGRVGKNQAIGKEFSMFNHITKRSQFQQPCSVENLVRANFGGLSIIRKETWGGISYQQLPIEFKGSVS
jgi:hypothetical protein